MADTTLGQGASAPLSLADTRDGYLGMVRRKRMYGGILLVLFIAIVASGWRISEERNAGDFWSGLPERDYTGAELMEKGYTCTLKNTRNADIMVLTKK